MTAAISAESLGARLKVAGEGMDEAYRVRLHRSISWLRRSEQEPDDPDARFLFLWIAFNAAYAHEFGFERAEREQLQMFFSRVLAVDAQASLHGLLFERFTGPVRTLIDNRYVYEPFWRALREHDSSGRWEEQFKLSQRAALQTVMGHDSAGLLAIVFDRLYVLRCQLVHGGATWNSRLNRAQVNDGASLLSCLVPGIIDLMIDHPTLELGGIAYPVVA